MPELAATPAHVHRARDRDLVSALVSGALGRVLAAGAGVLSVSVAARELGDTRYGVVATLAALVGATGFADLGVGSGLVTQLAGLEPERDRAAMQRLVSNAAVCLLLLGAVATAGMLLVAHVVPWGRAFGVGPGLAHDSRLCVYALAPCLGLGIAGSLGERALLGLQRGATVNAWAAGQAVAALLGACACAATGSPMWLYVVGIVGGPALVALAQTGWVLRSYAPQLRPRRDAVTRAGLGELTQLSGLFLTLNLAVAVAYETDTLVVATVRGAAAVAVFVIALRLFSLLTTAISAGSQQLWPAMAASLAQGDLLWVRSRLRRMLTGTVLVSGAVGLVFVVAGQELTDWWVGPDLRPPVSLLAAMAAWTTYSLVMSQLSLLLNAARIVGPQVVMALSMAVANVALSILLTQHLGLVGPVLGSLLAHVVCAGWYTIVLVRRVLADPA